MPPKIIVRPRSEPSWILDATDDLWHYTAEGGQDALCGFTFNQCVDGPRPTKPDSDRCPDCDFARGDKAPPKAARGRQAFYDVVGEAIKHATSVGLYMPPKPTDDDGRTIDPQLPSDLPSLTMDQLGGLYGQFGSMAGYAASVTAIADVEQTALLDRVKYMEAEAGLSADGDNAQQRKWNLTLDERYQAALTEHRVAHAKFVLLEALRGRLERGQAVLSRELTRRGVDIKD